jgi:endonuclease YncB( thermonuclease family)
MVTYLKRLSSAVAAFALGIGTLKGMENASLPQEWYPIPKGSEFTTGDSWTYQTVKYRLYGVQSCLRGTKFKNAYGISQDCGEASLAVLISLIRDLRPSCYTVVEDVAQRTRFVICMATIRKGPATGARIDLGTALITQGFGFASRRADGGVVHPAYGVAENQAQARKAGLWAFPDFPNPSPIISRALQAQSGASNSTSAKN